mmetsp:Transcript_43085/g.77919  ORF Transcript_43085/g.77919 Transcript_43085/m.77919 type:complete len:205 (+) Transcript_43085:543-1157(+)
MECTLRTYRSFFEDAVRPLVLPLCALRSTNNHVLELHPWNKGELYGPSLLWSILDFPHRKSSPYIPITQRRALTTNNDMSTCDSLLVNLECQLLLDGASRFFRGSWRTILGIGPCRLPWSRRVCRIKALLNDNLRPSCRHNMLALRLPYVLILAQVQYNILVLCSRCCNALFQRSLPEAVGGAGQLRTSLRVPGAQSGRCAAHA